jgi:hypothetical protein
MAGVRRRTTASETHRTRSDHQHLHAFSMSCLVLILVERKLLPARQMVARCGHGLVLMTIKSAVRFML